LKSDLTNSTISLLPRKWKLIRNTSAIILLSVIATWVVIGFRALDPQNLAWFASGDSATHYLSWAFFRFSPWANPLGLNPEYGIEIASAIVYADAIPLAAFIFKPLSFLLSEPFQYLGIWTFVCIFLQAYFGWLLAGLLSQDKWVRLLISALLIFSPPMLFRISFHTALISHFVILWALYLCLKKQNKNIFWQWLSVICITALINAYYLILVMGLWGAYLIDNLLSKKLNKPDISKALIQIVCILMIVGFIFWQSGYFSLPLGATKNIGFGIFRMNLLSLINPMGWSYVLPNLPEASQDLIGGERGLDFYGRTTESFNYLGLGIILIGLCAIYRIRPRRDFSKSFFKQHLTFIFALLLLTSFAVSNNVAIGQWQWHIDIPDWLFSIGSVWRASGRLFYPVFYLLILGFFYLVIKNYSLKAARIILLLGLIIQIADTSAGWLKIRQRMMHAPSSEIATPLQHPFWDFAAKHYSNIKVIPLRNSIWQLHWDILAPYAAKSHLPTNGVFLARFDEAKIAAYNLDIQGKIQAGQFEPKTLYIFEDEAIVPILVHHQATDLVAKIDGLNVLAPSWFNCSTCQAVGIPQSMWFSTRIAQTTLHQKITFGRSGSGPAYFIGGVGPDSAWAYPESWGTWLGARSGKIILPLPPALAAPLGTKSGLAAPLHALKIEFNALVFSAHPKQIISIDVNGTAFGTLTFTNSAQNELVIPIDEKIRQQGYIALQFNPQNAVSPKSIGMGDDERVLSIGLVAAWFD